MATTAPAAPSPTAAPFHFFDLYVVRTQRLSSTMLRITFGGHELTDFAAGGRDQRIKLFFPHPHQSRPVVPVDSGSEWFREWRAMAPEERGIMRSYTVRQQRWSPAEVDVDFALHGDDGPASRWASRARPGDNVTALGPVVADNRGVDFRPPAGTDWVLIAADETALPAAAGILAWLPADVPAHVWIEVPHAEDQQYLPTSSGANITWLPRDRFPQQRRGQLLDAVRGAALPTGNPYAWVAGESATVRSLRRHLCDERGFSRSAVTFTGYWRLGATEERLVAEAVSGTSAAQE
ncbi:NADPH-dependent ferric siderophore reductase [Haloactinospora alba]|uniref:NADPH-dependent ferric siderophore reductase n=1 Tax=Haloactinospora alba TaxID=405555 RepID=A0A543NHW3_9ACTN|nr:siderophore-interacting protein [Haloactinospora alba]TQN31425.1 NADPH-dependent ferric siderophore reductase [Haloactinospora alba]